MLALNNEDCLTDSGNILEQLTQEENAAAMPGVPAEIADDDDGAIAPNVFDSLSEKEQALFRLGSLKTMTYFRKNMEYVENMAISYLADKKAWKALGYTSIDAFCKAYGLSARTFHQVKANVKALGAETVKALRGAGYSKKDVNFLAAPSTKTTIEKKGNEVYIKIGEVKFNLTDKEALQTAILDIEKARLQDQKKLDVQQKEIENKTEEISLLKKQLDAIPDNEKALDSEMGKMFTTISGLLHQARDIQTKISGKKNLEDCLQANLMKINDHFMNQISEMLQ